MPLKYLTPEKLFKFIDYTMSHENWIFVRVLRTYRNGWFFSHCFPEKRKCFFVGIFKNSEKEVIKKEIFNIFLFNELQYIEELKRNKLPVSDIFSMRKNYAEQIRKSKFYKNTETAIFVKWKELKMYMDV